MTVKTPLKTDHFSNISLKSSPEQKLYLMLICWLSVKNNVFKKHQFILYWTVSALEKLYRFEN
jgi:hypothetical protein